MTTVEKIIKNGVEFELGGGGGGLSSKIFGDGSDGNCVIQYDASTKGNVFLEAKTYNFNNLTVCENVKLRFCGSGVPILRVKNCFLNRGEINLRNPLLQSDLQADINGFNVNVYGNSYYDCAKNLYDNITINNLSGIAAIGGMDDNPTYRGGGGAGGTAGGSGGSGCSFNNHSGGSGGVSNYNNAGGGGGGGGGYNGDGCPGCPAQDGIGGDGGNGGIGTSGRNACKYGSGGGGGYGYNKGGNGGNGNTSAYDVSGYGGDGGNSIMGNGGNGGSGGKGGNGGCSFYGDGGNGGCAYFNYGAGYGGCSIFGNGGNAGNRCCGSAGDSGKGGDSLYGDGGQGATRGYGMNGSIAWQGNYGIFIAANNLSNQGQICGKGGDGSNCTNGSEIYLFYKDSFLNSGTISCNAGCSGGIAGFLCTCNIG